MNITKGKRGKRNDKERNSNNIKRAGQITTGDISDKKRTCGDDKTTKYI